MLLNQHCAESAAKRINAYRKYLNGPAENSQKLTKTTLVGRGKMLFSRIVTGNQLKGEIEGKNLGEMEDKATMPG